jgi:hypothetical protein
MARWRRRTGTIAAPHDTHKCGRPLSHSLPKWSLAPLIYIIHFWHLYFIHQSQQLLLVWILSEHVAPPSGTKDSFSQVFSPLLFPLLLLFSLLHFKDTKFMKRQKPDNENNNAKCTPAGQIPGFSPLLCFFFLLVFSRSCHPYLIPLLVYFYHLSGVHTPLLCFHQ